MEVINVFLELSTENPAASTWKAIIEDELNRLIGLERVQMIGEAEKNKAQLALSYVVGQFSFLDIEVVLTNFDISIEEINIRFPSIMTGVSDAYGASGISLEAKKNLCQLQGVLSIGVSESGIVKVSIEPATQNKDILVENIAEVIKKLR